MYLEFEAWVGEARIGTRSLTLDAYCRELAEQRRDVIATNAQSQRVRLGVRLYGWLLTGGFITLDKAASVQPERRFLGRTRGYETAS